MAHIIGLSPIYLSPPTAFSHHHSNAKPRATTSSRSSSPSSIRSIQSINCILSPARRFTLRRQRSEMSIISIQPPSPTRSTIMEPDSDDNDVREEEDRRRPAVMEPSPLGGGRERGMCGIGEVLFG